MCEFQGRGNCERNYRIGGRKMRNRICWLLLLCVAVSFVIVGCKTAHLNDNDILSNSQVITTVQESLVTSSSLSATTESIQVKSYSSTTIIASVKISKKIVETQKRLTTTQTRKGIIETGEYSTKDDVYKYISIYGKLPSNYITKENAEKLGWKSSEGNLWEVTDKMSIGGDFFGNREGLLPAKSSRKYYECDINYYGGFRGAERIVYSNDGLIYYTANHYETFQKLG